MRLVLVLFTAALVAACDGAGDGSATPEETVTVTETATPSPDADGGDPCSPELADVGFIFVTDPSPGETVSSPFTVTGCSNTFEANVQWRLEDRDGAPIDEGFTTATCGTGCVGDFTFEVSFPEDERRIAWLEVFEGSPEDGSEQLTMTIPVLFER